MLAEVRLATPNFFILTVRKVGYALLHTASFRLHSRRSVTPTTASLTSHSRRSVMPYYCFPYFSQPKIGYALLLLLFDITAKVDFALLLLPFVLTAETRLHLSYIVLLPFICVQGQYTRVWKWSNCIIRL